MHLQVRLLGTHDPDDRKASFDLLTDGTLSTSPILPAAAGTSSITRTTPSFENNDFGNRADILVRAPEAAALSGREGENPEDRIGTPLDRCEDIEAATDGTVYATLTNNEKPGNFYGQVLRLSEDSNNPEAEKFAFEVSTTLWVSKRGSVALVAYVENHAPSEGLGA